MDVIRITLHSDLCAGNGESRGNAVDTDIVLTAAGLPRIPARRLKGCLRAAAGELAALGDEAAAYTAELFGDKVGRQGCLWVGDAALPQEAAFTAWLKQNPAWADHSRVEQLYTDVRGQTRLKDGVADDGSLRFTRVLGQYDPLDKTKALVFEAPVRLENASPEAVRLLEHCCAATRHMGTHRNRGLGNVRLAYIPGADRPAAPQAPDLPAADTVTLTYHVRLKTPLTLPGCGEQLTAIPARSVIGCLAGAYLRQGTAADAAFRQLFLDGTARWSPLTPVIGGKVSYPAPLALVYLKNDGVYANRCAETPTGKQKTLSGVYTAPGKNGLLAASVPTTTTYHHKHRDANSEPTLYMQQAIQAGLVYGGTVTLPTALAGRAAALLSTAPLRFGRSKTAQYAVCELLGRITAAPVQEAQVTVRKGEPFFVLLETDLILDTDAPTPEAAAAAPGADVPAGQRNYAGDGVGSGQQRDLPPGHRRAGPPAPDAGRSRQFAGPAQPSQEHQDQEQTGRRRHTAEKPVRHGHHARTACHAGGRPGICGRDGAVLPAAAAKHCRLLETAAGKHNPPAVLPPREGGNGKCVRSSSYIIAAGSPSFRPCAFPAARMTAPTTT